MRRNLLLSLAEAEFFRLRWSRAILDATERAIAGILATKGGDQPGESAARARSAMEQAFLDALVEDYEVLLGACEGLPDANDAHVLAAALKTRASMIVTENLKHFPAGILGPLNLEAKPADAFIADTLSLHIGRGVEAVRNMRLRFKRPAIDAEQLLLRMDADGLSETVAILHPHIGSL